MGKRILIIIAFIGCLLVFYLYASAYLNYCDNPAKSDVVVLFIGPNDKERLKEAYQLIKEGYTKTLFIPARREVLTLVNGALKKSQNYPKSALGEKVYPSYYENTHIEVLKAKKMMDMGNYTSAIFVSSPYHMRRISIIAAKTFSNEDYQLRFIGSRYLQRISFLSNFNWTNLKQTCLEYFKILGFFLYHRYEVFID